MMFALTFLGTGIIELVTLIVLSNKKEAFRSNATLYLSMFYTDLLLIVMMTYALLLFRKLEMELLIEMGVFKDLNEMNDKEMFNEYDKMRK